MTLIDPRALADKLDAKARELFAYRSTLDSQDHYLRDQWWGAAVCIKGLADDLRNGMEPLGRLPPVGDSEPHA